MKSLLTLGLGLAMVMLTCFTFTPLRANIQGDPTSNALYLAKNVKEKASKEQKKAKKAHKQSSKKSDKGGNKPTENGKKLVLTPYKPLRW